MLSTTRDQTQVTKKVHNPTYSRLDPELGIIYPPLSYLYLRKQKEKEKETLVYIVLDKIIVKLGLGGIITPAFCNL